MSDDQARGSSAGNISPRQKRINKIKALLAMTVENGASETEMLHALSAARKLMDEFDISETDLQFNGESVTRETRVVTDFDRIRIKLCTPVGRFCGCHSWSDRNSSDTLTYCGLQSETIFAHWLLDMLSDFVLREVDSFAHTNGVRTRRGPRLSRLERESFIHGCSGRIAQRLLELIPRAAKGTGKDLVVAKNALIDAFMQEHGIKFRETFKLYQLDADAYEAGEAAGDRAQFVRPVDGMSERKLLS